MTTKIDTTGQPAKVVDLVELYEALEAVNLAADKARRGRIGDDHYAEPDVLADDFLALVGSTAWQHGKVVMDLARAKAVRDPKECGHFGTVTQVGDGPAVCGVCGAEVRTPGPTEGRDHPSGMRMPWVLVEGGSR